MSSIALEPSDIKKYYKIPVNVIAEVDSTGKDYVINQAFISEDVDTKNVIAAIAKKQKDDSFSLTDPSVLAPKYGGSSSLSPRGGRSRKGKKSKGGKSRKARKSLRRK